MGVHDQIKGLSDREPMLSAVSVSNGLKWLMQQNSEAMHLRTRSWQAGAGIAEGRHHRAEQQDRRSRNERAPQSGC
jgi:hypothetical protein